MKRKEILNVIKDLSKSQGFYGRLLNRLESAKSYDPDAYDAFMSELEAQNFSDAVDLVIYLES